MDFFDDDIFDLGTVYDDMLELSRIDIKRLHSLLKNINDMLDNDSTLKYAINLIYLIQILSSYKTSLELEDEEQIIIPKLSLDFSCLVNSNDMIILFNILNEIFTLLKDHNILLKIKDLDIIFFGYNKKLIFNDYFSILNLKYFTNICFENIIIYNAKITDFKYFPTDVESIIFSGCEIKSCINFPKSKNIKFHDTCLPNNLTDLPGNINNLEIFISALQWRNFSYNYDKNNIKYCKEIISKYIGKLNNLPYNLKINQTNIIQENYIDVIQKLLKTYIKKTLKTNYRKNDLYKKLYRQFITKKN